MGKRGLERERGHVHVHLHESLQLVQVCHSRALAVASPKRKSGLAAIDAYLCLTRFVLSIQIAGKLNINSAINKTLF